MTFPLNVHCSEVYSWFVTLEFWLREMSSSFDMLGHIRSWVGAVRGC